MSQNNSILDKVLASKQEEQASQFNPTEFVLMLLKNLNTKEREILTRRFGLDGKDKQTLEQIGKIFQITRERIRQIQVTGINKIKVLDDYKNNLENVESLIHRILDEHGGAMEENHLLEKLLSFSENNQTNKQASLFVLDNLLSQKIERLKVNDHILSGWKTNIVDSQNINKALSTLHEIIDSENKLLKLEKIIDLLKNHQLYKDERSIFINDDFSENEGMSSDQIKKIIDANLRLAKKIDKNILHEWGLNVWPTIKPKRMSDKVYMILRKEEKPLHFRDIAEYINKTNFDSKVAHPATIHNELILNDKFVLIGRGIYALAEWGYNPGTVSDVIIKLLQSLDKPLTKEEIIKKVLDTRMVKKSTINLALTNKDKFKKTDKGYLLVE